MRKKLSIFRLILYIILIIFIYQIPLNYIESRSFCVFYNLFSIECVGCGTTRALFNIIHLNLGRAFDYNMLAFVWFSMFLLVFLDDLLKIIKLLFNKKNIKYSLIEKLLHIK